MTVASAATSNCMNNPKFTFIDLFSGIGSLHYSFKQLGGKCVLACDIDPNANSTYIFNSGVVPHENIWDLADRQQMEQIPDSDLLCAVLVKLFPK